MFFLFIVDLFRLGIGKQSIESTIIEESDYLINAVREEEGKVFDISVCAFRSKKELYILIVMSRCVDCNINSSCTCCRFTEHPLEIYRY